MWWVEVSLVFSSCRRREWGWGRDWGESCMPCVGAALISSYNDLESLSEGALEKKRERGNARSETCPWCDIANVHVR